MALQKKTLKESEVSTEIDLGSLLGDSAKNETIRDVFYQAAFDKMIERLDQGRGVDGKLHAYSGAYKKSLAFIAFGKANTVNMQLTGDMLSSIQAIEFKENNSKFTIGLIDPEQAAKAYGHITGMKGHPTLDGKVSPRDWFGWKDSELIKIANSIKPEINKRDLLSDAVVQGLLKKLVG